MPLTLLELASDFSNSLVRVDSLEPVRPPYQPGIGPHPEAEAVKLISNEMRASRPERYTSMTLARRTPSGSVSAVISSLGPSRAAVEVKLLRLLGDNGKLNDNMLMHVLSPYPAHRSALPPMWPSFDHPALFATWPSSFMASTTKTGPWSLQSRPSKPWLLSRRHSLIGQ